jgi:hypothetical protein
VPPGLGAAAQLLQLLEQLGRCADACALQLALYRLGLVDEGGDLLGLLVGELALLADRLVGDGERLLLELAVLGALRLCLCSVHHAPIGSV